MRTEQPRHFSVLMAGISALSWFVLAAPLATAADQPLTTDEMRALFSNTKHIDEWPNGDRGEASSTADGKVTYVYTPRRGKTVTDIGTWQLDHDNVACFRWKVFSNGCWAYFKSGKGFIVREVGNLNNYFKKTMAQ